MRVLFYGNRGNLGFRLAGWLRERGVDVRLLVDRSDRHARSQIGWERPSFDLSSRAWIREIREHKHNVLFPSRALRDEAARADVVFTSGSPVVSALALDAPVVLMPVGSELARLPFLSEGKLASRVKGHLMRRRIRRVAGVVTAGENLVRAARLLGVPHDRIHRYPMPVDVPRLREILDGDLREELHGRYGEYDAVFLSPSRKHVDPSRHDYKGTEKFLAALRRFLDARDVPDVRVVLGMHGRDAAACRRMVEEAGLGEVCDEVGHLPRPELHAFLSLENAVVFDQFGRTAEHSLGGVAREALALGAILVTATDPASGRFLEAYGPGCPLLPAFTEREIFGMMSRIADSSPGRRVELRRRARAWTERHLDWTARIDELVSVLEEAAAAGGRAEP